MNFLNGHECNWWSSFNGGVLALGLGCDDDGDPDGEGRTVTDLIMPCESLQYCYADEKKVSRSNFYVLQ